MTRQYNSVSRFPQHKKKLSLDKRAEFPTNATNGGRDHTRREQQTYVKHATLIRWYLKALGDISHAGIRQAITNLATDGKSQSGNT